MSILTLVLEQSPKHYALKLQYCVNIDYFYLTEPLNNMLTLKFKAQPTDAFFATINQMFGSSSRLPTTAKHCESSNTSAMWSEVCSTIWFLCAQQ